MGLEEKLNQRIVDYFSRKNTKQKPSGNRASSIGHPCLRYLVYSRTKWDEAQPIPQVVLEIFAEGNDQERTVDFWLTEMGFRLYNSNQSFPANEYELTGHIDGMLTDPETGESVPVDIKTNHPNIYPVVNSEKDLDKKPWMKKWYYQFQAYMLLLNMNEFWIIMKNKSVKQIKVIKVLRNDVVIDEIKKKCKTINRHLKKKTLPDRMNDIAYCETCEYNLICMPEMKRESIQIADDSEFLIMLDRRDGLQPGAKEFNELDGAIKKIVRNSIGEKFSCGDYFITKKTFKKTGFTVAESEQTVVRITKLNTPGA